MGKKKTNKKAKKNLIIAVGVLLIIIALIASVIFAKSEDTLSFGNRRITVEKVSSRHDKAKGLSGREYISEDRGMLFIYDEKGEHCMWMKDMNFPIDILWLDENKKVQQIAASVPPESFPDNFCPNGKDAKYVLEVKSGLSRDSGVDVGSQL